MEQSLSKCRVFFYYSKKMVQKYVNEKMGTHINIHNEQTYVNDYLRKQDKNTALLLKIEASKLFKQSYQLLDEQAILQFVKSHIRQKMIRKGQLRLFTGPRNSFKEYEMIRLLKQLKYRFSNAILIHNGEITEASIPTIKCDKLLQYKHLYNAFNVIGICNAENYPDLQDFYQLFNDKQLLVCYTQIKIQNIEDSTFTFLKSQADEIKYMSCLCEECSKETIQTFKINSQIIDLCPQCYKRINSHNH